MKKTSKHIYEVICSKRSKIIFRKDKIPFDILKNYLINSVNLQEVYFKGQIIKSTDILKLEKLNLLNLKVLDLMNNHQLSNDACIRFLNRCKNIEDLRLSCLIKCDNSLFYRISEMKQLKKLTFNCERKLNDGELYKAREVIEKVGQFVCKLNLETLNVYEISEAITTAYSKNEEKSNILECLGFATLNLNDGLDILKDLIFFQNLKQLSICYGEKDVARSIVIEFNENVLSDLLLSVCVNIQTLVIGGLLNDTGALVIRECLEKFNKITNLKLFNCLLTEEGLYQILSKGSMIRRLDLTGCLLCCTGEALKRNADESSRNNSDDSVLIRRGGSIRNPHLENLRELKMNVLSTERFALKNTLQLIYGNRLNIQLEPVRVNQRV